MKSFNKKEHQAILKKCGGGSIFDDVGGNNLLERHGSNMHISEGLKLACIQEHILKKIDRNKQYATQTQVDEIKKDYEADFGQIQEDRAKLIASTRHYLESRYCNYHSDPKKMKILKKKIVL